MGHPTQAEKIDGQCAPRLGASLGMNNLLGAY